jgi:protein TIF31
MKQIAEKVGIAERRVIASPIPSAISPELELEVVEDVDESALSAGELAVREHKMTVNQVRESEAALQDPSNKDANPQTIVLDDDDEEEGAAEDTHVRVAGAIEAKVLRGTDSRMYLLEAVRLTPRDANYVSATKGGSSKLPEDFLTKANAEGLCTAYLLRKELMQSFALHKTDLMRQRLVMEAVQSISAEKKLLPPVAPKDAVISLEAEDAGKDGKDGTIVNTTTPAATDITEAEINSKFHELLSRPENADVVVQATVPMNVNCFQDIECADDPATVHADEAHVRELSVYLFDILLPSLVEKVRTGHLDVLDGAQLTAALHTSGVNMRYLGRLAMLSREQELVDVDYSTRQSRRVRGMPFFLLELLETEMVARAFKVLLDTFCRLYDDVRSAPTRTIASMLNAVLGGEAEVPLESAPVSEVIGAKSKSKKHKTDLPQPFDAAANRQQFLNELEEVIYSRFNYKVILLHSTTEGRSGPLSRPTLLRRICQLAGVQVACRKYTFHSTPDSLVPSPIDVSDILALQPRLKGLKPYEIQPSRDITTLVEASRIMLNNNQLAEAFETAQAASLWCSQTLGPAHRDFSAILDTLTNAYVRIGDWSNAIAHCERNVMVLTQASGPDCAELVPKHHMLGILKAQSGLFEEAVKHMNAVKYLASLLGGPRHPMVTGALMQLGRMYKSMDMMPEAMMHYFEAQHTLHSGGCCDQNMLADLLADIAEVHDYNIYSFKFV